jgi:hypothetical protein
VTTQKPEFLHIGSNESRLNVQLLPLNQQEGAALLLKFLQSDPDYHLHGWDDSHNQEAESISTMVAGLPLGLAHVAGYITQARLTLFDFVNIIKTRRHSLKIWESDQPTYAWDYGKTLGAAHDLALSELSESSQKLLFLIAFFNPTQISRHFLIQRTNDSNLDGFTTEEADFRYLYPQFFIYYMTKRYIVFY